MHTVRALVATAAVALVGVAVGNGAALPSARSPVANITAAGAYQPPLPGPLDVLRPFAPPANRYGAGHLGVDLRALPDEVVRAAGSGTVRFAGQVAGRGVVVIAHPDGITTEYEPLTPAARAGTRVVAGQPIGVLRGPHRGCAGACLHWGAKRGGTYLDPLRLLAALGPVVLLPWTEP